MSRMAQSGLVIGGLAAWIVLTVFQSMQLNALEKQVREVDGQVQAIARRLDEGGLPTPRDDGGPRSVDGCENSPDNLLVCSTQPRARGQTVLTDQVLRTKIQDDPRGFNPYVANGADVAEYNLYINDQLGERAIYDMDVFNPKAAVKISTKDNLTFRVELRPDVYWHLPVVDWSSGRYDWLKGDGPDGRHLLTADDLAFTLEVIKNPQTSGRVSALRNYFEALDSWKVIDDHTVELTYSEILATNFPMLAEVQVLPRWLYMYDEDGRAFDQATWGLKFNEHWYNQRGIGVGPYEFVRWEQGVMIELKRNDLYWGEKASFKQVLMPVVKDQQTWISMLKTGQIDYTQIQPEQYKTHVIDPRAAGETELLGNAHIKLTEHSTLGYFYLGWNLDKPMFADKRVRRALTMALDREGIVRDVFYGAGQVVSGPFSRRVPCYDQGIAPWPYDLAAARALLEEAGWVDTDGNGVRDKVIDGKKVEFEFVLTIYGGSTEWTAIASIYREALLSIGIKMTPSALEWSTMLKKIDERSFDGYSGAWVMGWDTDLMQIWHSQEADRPQSSNRIGFRNPEADRIAEALRRSLDTQERVGLCHQFHALVHEEQPYTFIYERVRPVLYWDYMNEMQFMQTYPERDIRYQSFAAVPTH